MKRLFTTLFLFIPAALLGNLLGDAGLGLAPTVAIGLVGAIVLVAILNFVAPPEKKSS